MINLILALLLLSILSSSCLYIRRHRKKNIGCIGCPHAGSCSPSCAGRSEAPKGVRV